jgi:hypothetical protein
VCQEPHDCHEDYYRESPDVRMKTYKTQKLLGAVFGIEEEPEQRLLENGWEDEEETEREVTPIDDLDEEGTVESLESPADDLVELGDFMFTASGPAGESTPFDLDAIMETEVREAPLPPPRRSPRVTGKRPASEEMGSDAKRTKDSGEDVEGEEMDVDDGESPFRDMDQVEMEVDYGEQECKLQ